MKLLSIRTVNLAVMAVLALAAVSFGQTTFPGAGGGAIADGAGATTCGSFGPATNVTFNVTGISGAPTNVKLNLDVTHTWRGDLDVVLTSPDGTAFTIMKQTGGTTATACGSGNDLSGPYGFVDSAAGNWWTVTGSPTPAGDYRTSAPLTGAQTVMNAAFAGIPTSNGTWTLSVKDGGLGDTGTINAATSSLVLTSGAAVTADAPVDMNGDGKTDYAVVRNTGGGPSGQVSWFTLNNGGGVSGALWGIASDFFVSEDFDGDGKDDIAVWRPGAQGTFYIIRSSNGTLMLVDFGQTGDDPTVVADYDGDGRADPAVYRAGATAGAQSFWYYRGSLNNPGGNISSILWGQNGDFPAPGDYNGDGKGDFVVQRNAGGGAAVFYMLDSAGAISQTYFGMPTDAIVSNDYDGDGKTDIAVARGIGGTINWFILQSSNSQMVSVPFGAPATDFPVAGDYNGDGKVDPAIWRETTGEFWSYASGTGAVTTVQWGADGDYPIANFNTH